MKNDLKNQSADLVFEYDEDNNLRVENRDMSGKKSELIVKVFQDDHLTRLKSLVTASKISANPSADAKTYIETWFDSLR
jgi:hypothetical protein